MRDCKNTLQTDAVPEPLVTVAVCVFNAGQFLRPSLESVLRQTYANLEIIVVNDGSNDNCMESIRDIADPRLRIIEQKNQGKPASMNLILGKMTGEFYMIHDADDLSHPERVERQLAALLENPTAAAAFCGHELILNGRHVAPISRYKGPDQCRREIDAFRMPAHDPTGMYRWVSVRDLRYDATLLIGEGFDYILRVGERFPMLVLGECLYSYRIHPASLTKRNPAQRELLVREVLRQACKRRNVVFERHFGNVRERGHRSFDNNLAANFMESVCDLRDRGRYLEALKTGVFCSRLHPLDFHYQKALLYALTPRRLLSRIRRSI